MQLSFVAALVLTGFQTSAEEPPLPQLEPFLEAAKEKLIETFDETDLLKQYTYRMIRTREELGKNDRVKKTVVTEADVYHFKDGSFRRVTRRNGVPLTPEESRKQEERLAERFERDESNPTPSKRRGFVAMGPRQTPAEFAEQMDDVFLAFDSRIAAREIVDGRSTIRVEFSPRKNAKLKTRLGKMILKKVAGKVWVDENEHRLVRVKVGFIDDAKVAGGIFASLKKGTELVQEWRKINDEIWLPTRTETRFRARVLLKGFNERSIVECSDFRKFSVRTTEELASVGDGKKK